MLTTKIRCLVIRVPEDSTPILPQAAWREALPWADPYILGLIRKLQREVRAERAAYFQALREGQAIGEPAEGLEESEIDSHQLEDIHEEIIDAEEFTAEEWDESIR